jgi:hypothetical protein
MFVQSVLAFSLRFAAIPADAKDVNACDRIAFDSPTATQAGRSEFSCPLRESGLRAKLITTWKLVNAVPTETASQTEVFVDGKVLRAPVGRVFENDDPAIGPRTQTMACNGYFDLLLPVSDSASRDSQFATWRFDTASNRYIEDKQLSRLGNPMPLPGCSCYESFTHGGGDNFTYQQWCKRHGRWTKRRDLVQRSLGVPKTNDPRDYPDSVCDVRDTRFDAEGKAAMRRSKRCVGPQEVAAKK